MRNFKKYIISIIITVFLSSSIFAADWYVCLGSYKSLDNAKNLCNVLKENNIKTEIAKYENNDTVLYRVIYEVSAPTRQVAHAVRDKLIENPTIKKLGFTGLWVCEAVPMENVFDEIPAVSPEMKAKINEGQAAFMENQEIALTKNKENLPINKDVPYSVLIGSYKEEQPANRDKNRLKEKNIDSYIVKTYDNKNLFSFDLHTGAYKTYDEAEDCAEKLEELGISNMGISEYEDIEKNIELYNKEVTKSKITFETGEVKIPEAISPAIENSLRQFPINKNFQIERISITDLSNYNLCNSNVRTLIKNDPAMEMLTEEFDFENDRNDIEAYTYAAYKDNLFNKNVEVLVVAAEKDFLTSKIENILDEFPEYELELIEIALTSNSKLWNCYYTNFENDFYIYGTNQESDLFVKVLCHDFTETEFNDFINNIDNDGNLLVYPQVRKSLFLLPTGEYYNDSDFLYSYFSEVDVSYAEKKDFADWAIPIVGHWESSVCLNNADDSFYVSFFDMDYDFNAEKIHNMFKESHMQSEINSYNHPVTLEKTNDAWFVSGWFSDDEISFSKKSYIIAVDSPDLAEEDMIDVAKELQIWETK